MRKKQKKQIAIGIIVVILLGIVLSQTGINKPLSGVSGGSTLSLSQANLQSSNSYLDGKVWLLTFLGGTWGQYYTFSPEDVQDATSDSKTTTKSFTLKSSTSSTKCIYNIQSANKLRPIYVDLQLKNYYTFGFSCSLSEAESDTRLKVLYFGKTPTLGRCFAVGYQQKYEVSNLPSVPTTNTKSTITINANGKEDSITVDNLAQGEGKVGDFAYVKWNGVIPSGISCQQYSNFIPSDYYTSYNTNGDWIFIGRQNYDNYNSKFVDLQVKTGECSGCFGSNVVTQVQSLVDDINKLVPYAIQQKYPSQTSISKISSTNAQIIADSGVPLEFPLITAYIKASEIGIYTPTPLIKLSNPDSDCFKTGTQGVISAYAENTGDEEGTWNVYAICNNPFVSTAKFPISLNPDQSTLISIPISASSNQKTTETCTIYAESPGGTKSLEVGTCVDPQITCTIPYPTKFCEGNIVKQCSQDGGYSTIIKTCQYGCKDNYCIGESCKKESEVCAKDVDCCSGLTCESGKCTKPEVGGDCKSCTDWAKNFFRSEDKKCESTSLVKGNYQGFFSYFNPVNWGKSIVGTTGLTSQNIACPVFFLSIGIIIIIVIFIILIILAILGITINLFKGNKGLFKGAFNKRR